MASADVLPGNVGSIIALSPGYAREENYSWAMGLNLAAAG